MIFKHQKNIYIGNASLQKMDKEHGGVRGALAQRPMCQVAPWFDAQKVCTPGGKAPEEEFGCLKPCFSFAKFKKEYYEAGGWEKATDLLRTQQECSWADQFRQQKQLEAFELLMPTYIYIYTPRKARWSPKYAFLCQAIFALTPTIIFLVSLSV